MKKQILGILLLFCISAVTSVFAKHAPPIKHECITHLAVPSVAQADVQHSPEPISFTNDVAVLMYSTPEKVYATPIKQHLSVPFDYGLRYNFEAFNSSVR